MTHENNSGEIFAERFTSMITDGPVLLIAHNAHFDLQFVRALIWSWKKHKLSALMAADYLDSLTIFKDRAAYPHRLENAIAYYELDGKVTNSHRAIDDVAALVEVCKALSNERPDLHYYVNIFGYNQKYGIKGNLIPGVEYWPQRFTDQMRDYEMTLPAIVGRESFHG